MTLRQIILVMLLMQTLPALASPQSIDPTPSLMTRVKAYIGNASAQAELGLAYATGAGVNKDLIDARRWWEKAAAGGNLPAMYALGLLFVHTGLDGTTQDYATAAEWFSRAAERNYGWAQYSLGYMHEHGLGFPADDRAAGSWYLKAANNGIEYAQFNVAQMFDEGRGTAENATESIKWYRLAAKQGNRNAAYLLGRILEEGRALNRDLDLAATYYRFAAERDMVAAQSRYGDFFYDGIGTTPKRYDLALKWYNKAAEQGDVSAATQLAKMYDIGLGVEKNPQQARYWSEKSVKMEYAKPDYRCKLETFEHFLIRLKHEDQQTRIDKSLAEEEEKFKK